MKRNEKLAMYLAAVAIICLFIVLMQHYSGSKIFVEWSVGLSFGLIALSIVGLAILVSSSENKKLEEIYSLKKDFSKRELRYITAIVRDYPRGNFLLYKGSIWKLMKQIIEIDPRALDEMHFHVQIATFLRDQMERIIKENKESPLQEIKELLENADVAEAGDDMGVNQDLANLQAKVIEICGNLIITAAQTEYAEQCKNYEPYIVSNYLEGINRVEIFRVMELKSKLWAVTKKLEVSC